MSLFARRPAPVLPEKAHAAALALGLVLDGISEEEVRKAYRAAARAAHPDAGGDPDLAASKLLAAENARGTLLAWIAERPAPECGACGGTGFVRSGTFSSRACPYCTR